MLYVPFIFFLNNIQQDTCYENHSNRSELNSRGWCGVDSRDSERGPDVGCCEYGNEYSGSIK
jgi:hypothetical protein